MPVVAGYGGVVCSGVWRDMDVESKRYTDVLAASPEAYNTSIPCYGLPETIYPNEQLVFKNVCSIWCPCWLRIDSG